MNNNTWLWWLIGAIVIIGGGYLLWQQSVTKATDVNNTGAASTTGNTSQSVDVNDAGPDANTSIETI